MTLETFLADLPDLVTRMCVVGFVAGLFVPLVASALCAVVHTFKRLAGRG